MITKLNAGMYARNEKGFTLIELMIVIAIIGILAAIAIPQFSAYRKRGYNAAAEADLRNLATAQEAYYADHQTYNTTTTGMGTYGFSQSAGVNISVSAANVNGYAMNSNYFGAGNKTWILNGPGGTIN
jgi:type IV pilus assembly protein PilA